MLCRLRPTQTPKPPLYGMCAVPRSVPHQAVRKSRRIRSATGVSDDNPRSYGQSAIKSLRRQANGVHPAALPLGGRSCIWDRRQQIGLKATAGSAGFEKRPAANRPRARLTVLKPARLIDRRNRNLWRRHKRNTSLGFSASARNTTPCGSRLTRCVADF